MPRSIPLLMAADAAPHVRAFIEQHCEMSLARMERASVLLAAYNEWATLSQNRPQITATALGRALRALGFRHVKSCSNFWSGLGLRLSRESEKANVRPACKSAVNDPTHPKPRR